MGRHDATAGREAMSRRDDRAGEAATYTVAASVGPAGAVFGDLSVPPDPTGVVVFAHGSGSGRHSPRNRMVAGALTARGIATLLIDLLSASEDLADQHERFDIAKLAHRLQLAADEVMRLPAVAALPLGYFGASTGAGAALVAAGKDAERVRAIVSRGGRPDLATDALPQVRAPTLLIVGARDPVVLDLNRQAIEAMTCERELAVVPNATHLFEEAGTLERVTVLAGDWFVRHLNGGAT